MGILEINFAGRAFKLVEADQQDMVAHEIQNGSFEAPLPALLSAFIARTKGAFLDVGANSGLYTVLGAMTRADLKILAFEPLPMCIEALRRNIEINGIGDRVEVNTVALSDTSGSATLYIPDPAHGFLESSASLEKDFKPHHHSIEVGLRTLDELEIKQTISVVKVDIEGHEPAFLRGAQKTIARDRPFIFSEILGTADFNSFINFTEKNSYLPFRLRPHFAIYTPDIKFDIVAWNWALVPVEKVNLFRDVFADLGMEIFSQADEFAPRRVAVRKARSFAKRLVPYLKRRAVKAFS